VTNNGEKVRSCLEHTQSFLQNSLVIFPQDNIFDIQLFRIKTRRYSNFYDETRRYIDVIFQSYAFILIFLWKERLKIKKNS